jgi:hypothetical protein
MSKSSSPAQRKSARRITQPPVPAKPPRPAKPRDPVPMVSRIESDVELVAPQGCYASVIVKLVDRDDEHRYYSWWAMVGRNDMDKIAVRYAFTGEDTIRFDLPEGVALSARSLQPHLAAFLAGERNKPGGPPIIRD